MNSKLVIIIAVVVVAIAAVVAFVMLRGGQPTPSDVSTPATTQPTITALEANLFEHSQNPVKDALPEANPFAAKTNPFENVYKNPFDR